MRSVSPCSMFFHSHDLSATQIYTLSLHDALPIFGGAFNRPGLFGGLLGGFLGAGQSAEQSDRKSTRLNSSHTVISYAVFCLKKKNRSGTSVLQAERL